MKLRKSSLLIAAVSLVLIASCAQPGQGAGASASGSSGESAVTVNHHVDSDDCFGDLTPARTFESDLNPSRTLDQIFSTDSVGLTTITIRRSEWNKMLSYYDYFYKNENSVLAESYKYEKDGATWELKGVGMRLRGNTSRYRPQGKDHATDESGHTQYNLEWNQSYYNNAATCDDNTYRQSHFKIDFEPYSNDDRKMAGGMKGVALKRSDSLFSSEIFCYYLFRQYGIWTAPRASQTHVTIDIIEDVSEGTVAEDISACSTTHLNYGVYEMFEEVNKQSLKSRASKNNNAENAWKNNNGDLWKCSGGDLTAASNVSDKFGYEQVEILHTSKPKDQWSWIWYAPCYDLKTNKTNVSGATTYFRRFISELNNLSNTDPSTPEGVNARKTFYEKWFDVDFFIKTYAVNIIVGMDDDYWANANNYYLYFDNGKNGSGKCYLIPFDYDNTLGKSIKGDKVYWDPFKWGYSKDLTEKYDRPLLDRLLEVPEYRVKFKNALLEVSSQDSTSPWNRDKNIALWTQWRNQVEPYIHTTDVSTDISVTSFSDYGGWSTETVKHYLTQASDNIYEQVSLNLRYRLSNSQINVTFNVNGGEWSDGSTGSKTVEYSGQPSFDAMAGTPVKMAANFMGWSTTPDGSNVVEFLTGDETNVQLYASWQLISDHVTVSKSNFTNWVQSPQGSGNYVEQNITDNVSVEVKAESDGLHIKMSNSDEYKISGIDIRDESMGVDVGSLNGMEEKKVNGELNCVYPYVDENHVYNLRFWFEIKDTENEERMHHSLEVQVRATGGKGGAYFIYDGYTYDKDARTITFQNLRYKFLEDDNPEYHRVTMFSTELYDYSGSDKNHSALWKLEGNVIKFYERISSWDNVNNVSVTSYGDESTWLSDKEKHLYVMEYSLYKDGVSVYFNIIRKQLWPNQ